MGLLVFDLRGSIAHFRRPDTLGTHATYPFIPRTALHGLVGSILGLQSLPEPPRCGIRLLGPVRTVAHEMSMLGKGWMVGGSDFNRPTAIELVVKPHYRIYYRGPLQEKLTDYICRGRSHYHTYLGSAYCLTRPTFVACHPDAEAGVLAPEIGQEFTCMSVVPSEAIARLVPREGDEYARVGGIFYEHLGGRRFRGTLSVIYEVEGRPVTFVPAGYSESTRWEFRHVPGEGIVCLW